MSYRYQRNGIVTRKPLRDVVDVVRAIGDARRFMSVGRRMATGTTFGRLPYGSYVPDRDADPFYVGPDPDWAIGYGWSVQVTNSLGTTSSSGWGVIFRVFVVDDGCRLDISVEGLSYRKETERFVEMVVAQL